MLPNIDSNIKCGNSLIGPDYWSGRQTAMFDDDEARRVNPFDWNREFETTMRSGRFDAVIGNPPYGATMTDGDKDYIRAHYVSYQQRFDTYVYFVERGLLLLRSGGLHSYITPHLWLLLESGESLRRFVAETGGLLRLLPCGEGVFVAATVNTVVAVARRGQPESQIIVESEEGSWEIAACAWRSAEGLVIDYRLRPSHRKLADGLRTHNSVRLSTLGESVQGIAPYDRYRGQAPTLIKSRAFHSRTPGDDTWGRWLAGRDVSRYELGWSGEYLRYGPWLAAPRDPRFFEGPRLLIREVPGAGRRIQATIAEDSATMDTASRLSSPPATRVSPFSTCWAW